MGIKMGIIQITKRKTPVTKQYKLHNAILETVTSGKYLGVTSQIIFHGTII